jgi:hypothetical protein
MAKQPLKQSHTQTKQVVGQTKNLPDQLNNWCEARMKQIFVACLLVSMIFSALLFDVRVSLTGDDSTYIIRASDFVNEFRYPSFQGPLFPMMLSPIIALVGIKMIPLKILSFIFMAGFITLFYYAFRKRIPAIVHTSILALLAVNPYLLYYASQTYSEAMYLFLLAAVVFGFFKWFVDEDKDKTLQEGWKHFLYLGLLMLALSLTRSAGFAIIGIIGIYLIFRKQWKNLLWITIFFIALVLIFQGLKTAIWHQSDAQFSTQGNSLLYKNYYNPESGKEDLTGFVGRLVENTQLYVSKHFYMMLGMRADDPTIPKSALTTLFFLVIAGIAVYQSFKNNRYLFFSSLVAIGFCGLTFILLQTSWDQGRLIVPYFPFILMVIIGGLYYYTKKNKVGALLPIVVIFLLLPTLVRASDKIKEARSIDGEYYGLTPDWANYTKMSAWAAEKLPKDKMIASRKPSISFIYGKGRKFYSIDRVPTFDTPSLLSKLSNDTSAIFIVPNTQLAQNMGLNQLITHISPFLYADVIAGETLHLIYRIPKQHKDEVSKMFSSVNASYLTVTDLKQAVNNSKGSFYTVYPDSLLYQLKTNKVGFILSASLRKYASQKTNETVNTVERYMLFLQSKYPEIFKKVAQMGNDDDEPAMIYKIQYPENNQ